mmetsp:Transcript_42702/g.74821  ORF Transcript_42702/g.74821 Transcript_42702/m.74821 type:complete len:657 (+) Transcript_42702:87-2057(+)
MNATESIHRFLLLPSHVILILLLEFLNSFRSFGLRFVLYNYITNEYGISDTQAGAILGIKSLVDIGFGLSGSILVDMVGVRRVSLAALSVALVGRMLLIFGRSTSILYAALFLFSPCGDALLSVGLYRVALKKLTTPLTRPLAFGLSYAVSNMAGACVAVVVDRMRKTVEDVHVDVGSGYFMDVVGGVYTPVRQFIAVTWVVLFLTFIIAYCFLEDFSVIDPEDLDEEYRNQGVSIKGIVDDDTSEKYIDVQCDVADDNNCHLRVTTPPEGMPVEPMVDRSILQKWFPSSYQPLHQEGEEKHNLNNSDRTRVASRRLPHYKMFRTKYIKSVEADTSPCKGIMHILKQFIFIMQMRDTWKVLVFSFASVPVVLQWTASEIVLPPFLERRFGESIPIYTIQSIHMIGCLIFPPFAQAFTSALEDFRVVMPGLWIMAISPVFVAMLPTVGGACIWQLFMTVGQVLWSPRQDSWTAGLAPTGMEGLFFAVGSSRALLAPLGDLAMGMMNERYNTNCPECRDQYGHFCGGLIDDSDGIDENALQCASAQESCNIFLDNMQQVCPTTCIECPSWEPINPSTFWYILVSISIASPILAWVFLPFIRGRHTREDRCYGLCSMSVNRFVGICGAPEDESSFNHYGYIEDESDPKFKAKSHDISLT